MSYRRVAFLTLVFCFLITQGLYAAEPTKGGTEAGFDHTHSLYDKILMKFVVVKGATSRVRYNALKQDSKNLDDYLGSLSAVKVNEFRAFTEQQRIAFLVNAYNAFTLKHVISHYPISSIKDIGGFFKSSWKIKFFSLFGEQRTLDYIEHERLRVDYKEPRIHFALVCAAKSCPMLRNEAYTADTLDAQFENAAKVFLADESRNRYSANEKRFYLSKIFKWFSDDFVAKYGSVLAYVAPRVPNAASAKENTSISYTSYDWSLNDIGASE